jgi:hypothetical protein
MHRREVPIAGVKGKIKGLLTSILGLNPDAPDRNATNIPLRHHNTLIETSVSLGIERSTSQPSSILMRDSAMPAWRFDT